VTPDAHVVLAVLQGRQRHGEPPIPIRDLAADCAMQRRECEQALTELALAGHPIVSSTASRGGGVSLTSDPAVVRACARAYGRRMAHQYLRVRALRRTAARMEQPRTLWGTSS
jgi:hypothetical protein